MRLIPHPDITITNFIEKIKRKNQDIKNFVIPIPSSKSLKLILVGMRSFTIKLFKPRLEKNEYSLFISIYV